jgi:4-amino-4-deoxy-L-arabinose transferase-like glycosyltransferase
VTGLDRRRRLLAALLIYAAAFRLLVIDRPFHNDTEGHGSFFGVLARNYVRFGWSQTHGIPVLSAGQGPDTPMVLYPDHPPLVPALIAPVYALFGVGAWQTRLPTSIATVAAIYALYLLLKRHATPRTALIAAALFAAAPMTLYFGGLPEVVGMPLVLFVLLSTLCYLNFHAHPGLRTLAPLVVAFTLAGLSDWPAFIIVPVFLVHFLATRPRREWRWILAFCGTSCALFAALYVYIALATNAPWDWMVPLFLKHSTSRVDSPLTVRGWFATALAYNRARHTLPLLIASGVWVITRACQPRRPQPGTAASTLLIAWGLLHVIIGRHGVYEHEWWWWPLTPGIAISAALAIDSWSAWATNGVTAVLIVLFACWTTASAYRELYPSVRDEPYSTVEMGEAIRAAAPHPNDVALVFGADFSPQWWFYGDRLLRLTIWSIEDFERRFRDDTAEVTYGFEQPCREAGAGMVLPRVWARDLPDLRAYLEKRFPSIPLPPDLSEKFEVFDLRRAR